MFKISPVTRTYLGLVGFKEPNFENLDTGSVARWMTTFGRAGVQLQVAAVVRT